MPYALCGKAARSAMCSTLGTTAAVCSQQVGWKGGQQWVGKLELDH